MKISFLGAGNMAGAIINSLISSGRSKAEEITIFDKKKEQYDKYRSLGVQEAFTVKEACDASTYIVIAVKPQDYSLLLSEIKNNCDKLSLEKKVFISIAAGISSEYICRELSSNSPVIRVMPNTPLLIGQGATALSRNSLVSDKDFTSICAAFSSSGLVCVLPEEQMNTVISVNSSSPAYVYLFAKAMIDGAVLQGFDRKTAETLTFQTIKGAAEMLIKTDMDPDMLIKMVSSPGGTTEAALNSFNKNNFEDIIYQAMLACTERAKELEK